MKTSDFGGTGTLLALGDGVADGLGDGGVDGSSDGVVDHDAGFPTSPRTPEAIREWLVAQLAERLLVDTAEIDVREPLTSYGLDSIQAMGLIGDLEDWLGRPLSLTVVDDYPSIEALVGHLVEGPDGVDRIDHADPSSPGSARSRVYLELDGAGLDLERCTAAFQRLIDRHDLLRTVVLPDGERRVLEQVPPYQIEGRDLRGRAPHAVAAELAAVRQSMIDQPSPADRWPLFEVQASYLDDRITRLHFSLDPLIAGETSAQRLIHEWSQLYQDLQALLESKIGES